ncbi:MAG: molybdopterin-dependent oxidoreductase [Polyangiales bacterium]
MAETHTTFCRICEALCGLEVTVENDEVIQIRPDDRHVATRGYGCVKGLKQHRLVAPRDRLKRPLKRVGNDYVEIGWDQALAEIGAKVKALRGIHPDSIAMYVGTAAGFGVLHPVFAQGFMTGVGSKSMFASATQDCSNKFAVARQVYGFPFTQPFPDVDRIDCLIVVGANPAISKWSFLQVSNPIERLREIEARGGRIFVVDPRKTETAKVAGEHVFIRPGTDVFFYLAFLNELIRQGGVDHGRIATYMTGWDEVKRLAEAWTPERVEGVTQMPASKLRELVTAYRTAKGAALYCSTGVNMGGNGGLAFWIQEVINAVSGNLDRKGGLLVGRGVIDFAKFGQRTGTLLRSDKSRIGAFESVNDAFPGGILADEILTPGENQIRALFVTGGNPLITMANSNRLRKAFEKLELLVCLDVHQSETASMAHYVLPCTTPLERPDLPFIFPLMLGLQSKPYLQATRRLLKPTGEARDEATIYTLLAKHSGAPLFGSKVVQKAMELALFLHSRKHPEEQPALPQEGLLNLLLRLTGQMSFDELLRHEHGFLREDHVEADFLGKRVITDDRKVHLAPSVLMAQASKLEGDFEAEKRDAGRLKLITKRAITTHNSWTHNFEDFVRGDNSTNYLYMHPQDAEARGLENGALVDVTSETATVRVPMRHLADLMPGVCALPHGWGHQAARGLSVASKTTGVNVNILAADGPEKIEKVTGMARLTGILVEVERAKGPHVPTSWSGLADG